MTPFYKERQKYKPKICEILKNLSEIELIEGKEIESISDQEKIKELFPKTYGFRSIEIKKGKNNFDLKKKLRLGLVFLGGNSPGGHNVIVGLYDALKEANPENELIGYIGTMDCTFSREFVPIVIMDDEIIDAYRNSGGYDLLGADKIKENEFEYVLNALNCSNFDGMIIIGGDDSNTLTAKLTEYFYENNRSNITLIGIPATTHGNLYSSYLGYYI